MSDLVTGNEHYYNGYKDGKADGRAEVIAEISREMRLLYGNEYEQQIRTEIIDECINVVNKYHNHTIYHYECVNALEKLKEIIRNDCFWCFINGVCDCENCGNCKEYISVNSDKGMELYEKYQSEVEEALKPLSEKWKQLKEQNK